MMLLYNTLILPHFIYCIQIWANSSNQNMSRILKLQKKAVRIISHSNYLAHTQPIFYSLKVLNIYDIYILQSAIFMYLCSKKRLPISLMNNFCLNKSVHNYQTRSVENYHIPRVRLTACEKSIFFQGPKIWNDIPHEIKTSPSLNVFKRRYKKYLISAYMHN